ncbi:hypothetical protein GGR52DRAFT_195665 [Hypoxylon sp. FL1284]|nr:hypothetical protein GGR52DRAFT_195665 [Hypoxylon sp. FL1284]
MSKPDKYKGPEEKGIAVPTTANNEGQWKPYTIPYSGAGADRQTTSAGASQWRPQRQPYTSLNSHPALPLSANSKPEEKVHTTEKSKESADIKGKGKAIAQEEEDESLNELSRVYGNQRNA